MIFGGMGDETTKQLNLARQIFDELVNVMGGLQQGILSTDPAWTRYSRLVDEYSNLLRPSDVVADTRDIDDLLQRIRQFEWPDEPTMENEPRALTKQEMLDTFLSQVAAFVTYWEKNNQALETRAKLEGLAFSIMTLIDGVTGAIPPLNLVPVPHPGDKAFHRGEEENWVPTDTPINDEVQMHKMIVEMFKQRS